ncbi:MAG: PBSX family phage terminase large subunit [Clostridiales bacterium]|nr:MAG: PBSX family phage terminase large subunit [Clostridiales bacterium]
MIAPHFYGPAWDIQKHKHTHYWLDGGRGSTKSSFISLEVILLLIQNPSVNALVLRKVGETLRDSVFAQILWAIDSLSLSEYFKHTTSPMEITYLPTGQKIFFRGADNPKKIKSLKPQKGYIGITWYEELDQFFGMEEIRNINQSTMRGGSLFWIFYSYNPPKSRDSWVNVEKMENPPNRLTHHSTYLDVPREWLGDAFIFEAETLKARKPEVYEHEYMGVAIGTGGAVFDNIQEREISAEEIETFDRLHFGVDFGFAIDPFVWIKMHYSKNHQSLYLLDEIYQPKLSNRRAADMMRERGTGRILADCAEPKSIAEIASLGIRIDPAKKGPDSVEYGIKWLQSLDAIIIDKSRTPNAYKEFSLYEYEQNKDGEFISAFPDKNNHAIDACRYGLSELMRYNSGWGFGKTKI